MLNGMQSNDAGTYFERSISAKQDKVEAPVPAKDFIKTCTDQDLNTQYSYMDNKAIQ